MALQENQHLIAEFATQGYILCRKFFSESEIVELRDEITRVGRSLAKADYLNKDKMIFYSNVFLKSEYVQSFISQKKVVELLRQFTGPDFWVRWDQCVVKGPGAPVFPWHQDNAYSRLRDTHCQLWIGLTAMDEKNGGLWLQPGSHKSGLLPHRRVANHLECKSKPGKEVLISTEKGDIVLFSSFMLHYTGPNESSAERGAYVVEYLSLDYYDPLITPPYFIVAEGGMPAPRFARSHRGSASFKNRMKYLPLQTKERCKDLMRGLVVQRSYD